MCSIVLMFPNVIHKQIITAALLLSFYECFICSFSALNHNRQLPKEDHSPDVYYTVIGD